MLSLWDANFNDIEHRSGDGIMTDERLVTPMEGLAVTQSDVEIDRDDGAIQALSEKLKLPALKVIEVYRTEFKRLAAQSRIETYLGVLAMRNTRRILRETCKADAN